MSSSLPVIHPQYDDLPDGHDCKGCPGNCCDPVIFGGEGLFPLPYRHPEQPMTKNQGLLLADSYFVREYERLVREQIFTDLPQDRPGQFWVVGYAIDTSPGMLVSEGVQTIRGVRVALFRSLLYAFIQCRQFDPEHRVCRDYGNRPDMCQNKVQPTTCGMSPNHPTHPMTGQPHDIRAHAARQQAVVRRSKRNVRDEVIALILGKTSA